MRRFMLPIFAGLTIATALTACDKAATPDASPTTTASPTPTAKGDDKVACATAKSARTAVLNDLIMAMLAVSDEESTSAEVTEAAATMQTAFTKLSEGMNKAADQAETAKLKESLRAYAAGAKTVVTNIQAAGADRSKLDAATELPDMDAAEKTAMTICA